MTHCILFYKYTPLSNNKDFMTFYQNATKNLCLSLELTGRVLIGLSNNAEGLNGTLAGTEEHVLCYTYAMLGKKWCIDNNSKLPDEGSSLREIIEDFFTKCEEFSKISNVPIPTIDSPEDFKWSSSDDSEEDLFPDLQIKLVKEIISTGGVLSSISIDETSKDYLTPDEWHEEMKQLTRNKEDSDTILIDCRNHKEYAVGHFDSAIDPNTKIFAQFPRWVQENKTALKDKKVLMYCTGGIRCEKASAYIRNELKDVSSTGSVYHLKGGIHKYLDKYASNGYFRGKNFVFDRRLVMDADEHKKNDSSHMYDQESNNKYTSQKNIVGKCQYCDNQYDNFTGDRVCTVCRELALVCEECHPKLNGEFHCMDHFHLRDCYFTNLANFKKEELHRQLTALEARLDEIAVGKRYKQKRNTLLKQCVRIRNILSGNNSESSKKNVSSFCRSCGDELCIGNCWGFHGLKRKNHLENGSKVNLTKTQRTSANKRQSKVSQKENEIKEIQILGLSEAPNMYRVDATSLRCPPPCIRVLTCSVKGKWCGRTIKGVLASEFHEFSNPERLSEVFKYNLIYIDGIPVNADAALRRGTDAAKALSPDTLLKNMDTITRIQHWHEPPIKVPNRIDVNRAEVPKVVCNELIQNFDSSEPCTLYCIDKPATVPVHHAGAYYQNSLLLMVEAQEGLETKTLLPCHRVDRCTSGLTICCTNPKLARLIQVQMDLKAVSKMYLAKVNGKFPNSEIDCADASLTSLCSWCIDNKCVEVNAPICVLDNSSGLRGVREDGKTAKSRFKFISFDESSDTSLISCFPVTGRQHQLRVHLQAIGFPIINDVLYGGDAIKNSDKMFDKVVDSINDAIKKDKSSLSKSEKITQNIIQEAKDFCLCCKGETGMKQYFSTSQLLMGGHQIELHALAYRIKFKSNKKDDIDNLEPLELSVKAPSWALNLDVSNLEWLDN